jgi:SAM-dependent methyltransferase
MSVRKPPGPMYAAIGLGAFLLFLVQPMAARFVLPWFGGGPTVWSTCLLFFQVALLAGYGYAHLTRRLSLPRQAQLHVALLLLAALTLPIAPSAAWKPVDAEAPGVRILLLLAASLGAPYVVLAATAPLMQDWFARGGPGGAPYRLYAWSNAGSLAALLLYPLAVEPFLPMRAQALVWSALFMIFCLVCAWSAVRVVRVAPGAGVAPDAGVAGENDPAGAAGYREPAAGDGVMWVVLAACGSGLLLAATNELCQNIAIVPLLWILPLTCYLLTFIFCFADGYRRSIWAPLLLVAVGGAAWASRLSVDSFALQMATVFGVLIAGCMVCHGELVRIRPDARRLTSFYLAVAAGGSLGGVSVALVAPSVLDRLWEFPIFALLSLLLLLIAMYRDPLSRLRSGARPAVWTGLFTALCVAAVAFTWPDRSDTAIEIARTRNFYGVMSVDDDPLSVGPRMRRLHNGRILHGAQFLDPAKKDIPATYYGDGSGIDLAIRQHPRRLAAQPLHIAVVGLGAGTMAALGEAGDTIRFFEINPAAETFARRYFTFLADSAASITVVIGDARLSLERGVRDGPGAGAYDVIAVDAFSGDAIPVHLLTREALAVYLAALRPGGVLALHVSNRYLDLRPVVRGLAQEAGQEVLEIEAEDDGSRAIELTTWMLVTSNETFAAGARSLAQGARAGSQSIVWTDTFSSLIPVLKR